MSDAEEVRAITRVLNAFYTYKAFAYSELIEPKKLKYASLPKDEQKLLSWFPEHILTLEHCIEQNSMFFQKVALTVAEDWGADAKSPSEWEPCTMSDYDKVKATLKQLLREWSDEGANERDQSFSKVMSELEKMYPEVTSRQNVNVLIPGVGLGRLNIELVKRGFRVQGNEFSYYMLFLSNFILNSTFIANNYQIYPFIHSTSNQTSRALQTRPIYIPDIQPTSELQTLQSRYPEIPVPDLMSIVSGSFVDMYGPDNLQVSPTYSTYPQAQEFRNSNRDTFDVIITMFFLDTATNIIEYLKALEHTLKTTGNWINFGPLLWHFEDDSQYQRITLENGEKRDVPVNGLELTENDLLELIRVFFHVDYKEHIKGVNYGSDTRSLGRWYYDCDFLICHKK